MASSPNPKISIEEFLALDSSNIRRWEFHDGKPFEIENASLNHGQLCTRLAVLLSRCFPDCEIFDGSSNVFAPSSQEVVKPDVFLLCTEREVIRGLKGVGDALLNPTLVAEVTSEGTEDYDKGRKADFYRSLPSLKHYLLVSQFHMEVQHYLRSGEDRWDLHVYRSEDQAVSFDNRSLLVIGDLYRAVTL